MTVKKRRNPSSDDTRSHKRSDYAISDALDDASSVFSNLKELTRKIQPSSPVVLMLDSGIADHSSVVTN